MKKKLRSGLEKLAEKMSRMNSREQEIISNNYAMIIIIAVAFLLLVGLYPAIPRISRLMLIPIVILLVWFFTSKRFR